MIKHGLEYILALKDNMTPKVKGIVGEVEKIGTKGKEAITTLGAGLAGVVGVGASLQSVIAPALELDRALGELTKLNVGEKAIESVKDKALQLSTVIGESAESIAKNAYNVKKALNGINDTDLADVNNTIHLLGSVTRTGSENAAKYMGVLHGIFNKQAKELGEAKWADQMAGKTEKATKLFGASLDDFNAGFAKLSNSATKYGISFDEQLAIMGELTRVTGNGGVAAGKYQKILKGLGKAQSELGISFKNSTGKMDSMPVILDKIRAKYGQKIPVDKLRKALGEDAAGAVIHLLNQTDKLKSNLNELNQTTDGKSLITTAADASDGFLKVSAALANLKTAIGGEMLKVLYPVMDFLSEWGNKAVEFITQNKEFAATLGKVTLGFFALMAAAPVLMTLTGMFKLLSAGSTTLFLPLKLLGKAGKGASLQLLGLGKTFKTIVSIFSSRAKFFYAVGFGIGKSFLALKAILAFAFSPLAIAIAVVIAFRKQIAAFVGGFIKGIQSVTLSFAPFSAAFERIREILGSVIQRFSQIFGISAESATGLQNWAEIGEKAGKAVGEAINFVIEVLADVIVGVAEVGAAFAGVFAEIITLWKNVTTAFADDGFLSALEALAKGVWNIFESIFDNILSLAAKAINWLIDKINRFTGTNFSPIEIPVKMDIPPLPKEFKAVGVGLAGSVGEMAGSIASLPESTKPASFNKSSTKNLTSSVSNSKSQVVNHINVNMHSNASPQDTARAIAERARMGA